MYNRLLDRIISDGIVAAKEDYADDPLRLEGAIAGFEACRGKSPGELQALLTEAMANTQVAFRGQAEDYWRIRSFEAEVEWVCNVVSALLAMQGDPPVFGSLPTARGLLKAVGVLKGSLSCT